jgi:dipeptidyl aminopeptidase/acylaminoacyl peptidase
VRTSIVVSSLVAAAVLSASAQAPRRAAGITIDALLDIRHPSRAVWSPDGSQIAYVWDRGGVQNVYTSVPGAPPKAVTTFDAELIDGLAWSHDGAKLLFARGGDLWEAAPAGSEARRVWTTPEAEATIAVSPDGRRAAFERAGDLWVRELASGAETRLTSTAESESTPVWSPDGAHIAFTSATVTRRQDTPEFSGAKLSFNWFERTPSDVGVVPSSGGAVTIIGRTPGVESSPKWVDAQRLVFQRISPDLRTREIVVANVGSGQAQTLAREQDDKWWSPPASSRPEPDPSPDGQWIAFLSDRDGWDHLYVVRSAGGTPIPITTGAYEVRRPRWAPDSKRIAFDVNDGSNPGQRHLAIAPIDDKAATGRVALVTGDRGTDIDATWRPDGRRLLFQHTDSRSSADLFVVDAAAHATPERLTDSLPPTIDRASLVEPQFVRYAAPDGKQVPAFLFVPPDMAKTPTHPAVVWIHGDGTNENYDGWHVERNYAVYYSVHQYLLQRGYVVLAVDYRGSIGYGRAWRQGHYRDLGGRDYDDVAAGVAFLKSTGYVDASRIGVWGLSYGGFMTLQALTRTPELFRCGIDVAGVDDWRDWHRDPDGPWINARMGSPQENAEIYRRTAPIERVNDIVQPLLVLHGTADVNVPFYESVRLVDALVKANKRVEFMMYPGEFHYFWRAHVLRDAWQQVDRFFAAHLAPPPRTPSSPQ